MAWRPLRREAPTAAAVTGERLAGRGAAVGIPGGQRLLVRHFDQSAAAVRYGGLVRHFSIYCSRAVTVTLVTVGAITGVMLAFPVTLHPHRCRCIRYVRFVLASFNVSSYIRNHVVMPASWRAQPQSQRLPGAAGGRTLGVDDFSGKIAAAEQIGIERQLRWPAQVNCRCTDRPAPRSAAIRCSGSFEHS